MKLKEWLDENKITYTRFSKIIGISPQALWKIFWNGTNNLKTALEIEKVTLGAVQSKDLIDPEVENTGIKGRKSKQKTNDKPKTPKHKAAPKRINKRLT